LVRNIIEIKRVGWFAIHAERGGIHQEPAVCQKFGHRVPGMSRHSSAEMVAEFLRPSYRPVDHADVAETARLQRIDDRSRRATGSQNGGCTTFRPARCPFIEIG